MARKKINYYVFAPGAAGAGTVKLPDYYTLDDILMITNVTRNTVIYNFGDPNRGATISFSGSDTDTTFTSSITGYTNAVYNGVTTLTLNYSTTGMLAGDVLQIYVESDELKVRPYDFGVDAVERQRVGIPRSMIDADFEYGLQTTKWAGFTTYRNVPTTFAYDGTDFTPNAYSYVTMVTGIHSTNALGSPAQPNMFRSYTILNQGNSHLMSTTYQGTVQSTSATFANAAQAPFGSTVYNTYPQHNINDYKLIVNQPTGYMAPAIATWISNARPITYANGGIFQRTFSVQSTAEIRVNDIVAAIGLPILGNAGPSLVNVPHVISTIAANTAGPSIVTANSFQFGSNTILAIELNGLGSEIYELVHLATGATVAAGGQLTTGTRQLLGTGIWAGNRANVAVVAGGKIIALQPGSVSLSSNVQMGTSIELMRVDAINSTTNEVTVTRSWMGTNARSEEHTSELQSH